MNVKYKEYIVELIDETSYTLNSSDNIHNYDKIISDDGISDNPTKYGINIRDSSGIVIKSCLLIGGSGAGTSVGRESCVIEEDTLFVCISNEIFSLSLINLELNWYKEVDFATAFGIYKMNEDFIIHGEMYITRINRKGEIIWQQSGSDIFVLPISNNSTNEIFEIKDNMIFAQSWDERKDCISYNGEIS